MTPTSTTQMFITEQLFEERPLPTQGLLGNLSFTLQLLKTNGGCYLPCWWGMVPGVTKWENAEPFLKSFTPKIEKHYQGTRKYPSGESYVLRAYDIYINMGNSGRDIFGIESSNNVISGFELWSPITDVNYNLNKLLKRQGIPTKIIIKAKSHSLEGWAPFDLLLYYQDQHFYATYSSNSYQKENEVVACLNHALIYINVYQPWVTYAYQELIDQARWSDSPGVLPVEKALAMTPAEFYNVYKDAEPICIKTPTDLWP